MRRRWQTGRNRLPAPTAPSSCAARPRARHWLSACLLAAVVAGCVRRLPETGDWEADATAVGSAAIGCPAKDVALATIDRTFRQTGGTYTARRLIVTVTGCDQEVILVWTPEVGWLHHPPQAQPPRPKVKTGPVLDGKVIKP